MIIGEAITGLDDSSYALRRYVANGVQERNLSIISCLRFSSYDVA